MRWPFRVSVNEVAEGRTHLSIERDDGKPIRVGWDKLQAIKNEYVGKDVCMVEFFPAQNDIVNEVNRRHFWTTIDLPPLSHGALPPRY